MYNFTSTKNKISNIVCLYLIYHICKDSIDQFRHFYVATKVIMIVLIWVEHLPFHMMHLQPNAEILY